MSNIDPQTVSSFGDEWLRFDQSAMSIIETQKALQTVRKVGGKLQAVAQIEIFRQIWDSRGSSRKQTKEGRVKTRLSFRTVCLRIAHRLGVSPSTLYWYIPTARSANVSGG